MVLIVLTSFLKLHSRLNLNLVSTASEKVKIYVQVKIEKDCCQNVFRFNNDCVFSFD